MLQLKLTNAGLSSDGTQIVLRDDTGNYNAGTNPGGYGTPNPTLAAAVVSLLRYYVYGNKPVDIPVIKADMTAGKVITPFILGLTSDNTKPYLIPDGVNVFEYLLGYNVTGAISILGPTVNVTGLTLPASLKYVSFSSQPSVLYEVETQTSATLVLTKYPDAPDTDTLIAFYSDEAYVLVTTYINRLIDKKVIGMQGECENDIELFEDVMNLMASASRFSVEDYLGANTLITTLNRRYAYASR